MICLQREITNPCNIFEENGEVLQAGWARKPVFRLNEEQSKARGRLGERDSYFVNNGEVSLYLSVENFGTEFSINIAVADLKRGGVISDCVYKKLHILRGGLPKTGDGGEFFYTDKRMALQLGSNMDGRFLKCEFEEFGGRQPMEFRIVLKKTLAESLNELAPFERNRRYFYLKRFAPDYTARGMIRVGGMNYSLEENSARAYLDWTRFSKPRPHHYQRLSADCIIDGKRFSLCLASRVGDNRYGNENCFFYEGKLEKLSQINVKGTPNRMDRPFYFRGGMSALDITFKPFTVQGNAMTADMSGTSVIFGRLYGTINRLDMEQPLVLDNAQAHLVFSEF